MKKAIKSDWPLALLLCILTSFQLWGTKYIPFHPDESTQLFMSADFDRLLTHPLSLAWNPNQKGDIQQHYRLIDAPITRYLLGLVRNLAGFPPLSADWDWSKTWDENRESGALPNEHLLFFSRLGVTFLLPFSLLFMYLLNKRLAGPLAGIIATFLLGSNALVLLHARRAMAEGALLLGVSFFVWSLFHADKKPWLSGLAIALAYNAKQSTLALFPIGLIAVSWMPPGTTNIFRRVGVNLVQYLGIFILVTLALNPVQWRNPPQAIQASILERQNLLSHQVSDIQFLAPEQLLSTPGQRLAILVAHLSITPPMFAEVGNYLESTASAERTYLAIPGHTMFRGLVGGGFTLATILFGLIVGGLNLGKASPLQRREVILLFLATVFQSAGLILAVPLPWQRYIFPLIPLTTLWASLGIIFIIRISRKDSLWIPQDQDG